MEAAAKITPSLYDLVEADPCDLDRIRGAVRAGADVNEIRHWPHYSESVLMEAVATSHDEVSIDVVRFLVESGADISYRDPEGGNVLSAALYRHEPDLIAGLLHLGADPNVIVDHGAESLLDMAEFDLYYHSELTDNPASEIDAHAREALTAIIDLLKSAGAKRLRELKAGPPDPQ